MSFGQSFHDTQPITWWKRLPVYATTILTAGFALGLIVSVLIASAHGPVNWLTFSPRAVTHGAVWQLLTYPFIDLPNFFTLLGVACFYSWAIEIEKYLGRARFFTLIGALTLAPAFVSLVFWAVFSASIPLAGNYFIVVAALVGFATLYPNIEYFGWIPLKWFAAACILLGSLMYFPNRDWISLGLLWMSCAIAFGYIRLLQRGVSLELPKLSRLYRSRSKLRVLPDPESEDAGGDEEDNSMPEVDALLDKIARSGIGSLTAGEKKKLEKAREELLKRESPRR